MPAIMKKEKAVVFTAKAMPWAIPSKILFFRRAFFRNLIAKIAIKIKKNTKKLSVTAKWADWIKETLELIKKADNKAVFFDLETFKVNL